VDLRAMRAREAHEGEHLLLGRIHHVGELGKLLRQLVGHDAPLVSRGIWCFLREAGVDQLMPTPVPVCPVNWKTPMAPVALMALGLPPDSIAAILSISFGSLPLARAC
jgi:hypothetical protein